MLRLLFVLAFAITPIATIHAAEAAPLPKPAPAAAAEIAVPAPPAIEASGYILIDASTGKTLAERNADEPLAPASLTKIMTSYIAAREIASGRISLDSEVPISVHAWRAGSEGSRMFIQEGRTVKLDDLLKGIIVQSGNDSSIAVAEFIAGSEDAFADMMNQQAAALGMRASQFRNATGLPVEGHITTARDLATLTRALIANFPEHYKIYSMKSFRYNDIDQPNRNRLLWRDRTVDGVKTGHTDAAGYCLVASAVREGMRLISVVLHTDSDEARMVESQKLLSYGFRYFQTQKLYDPGVMLKTVDVWYGADGQLQLGVKDPVWVTIPRGHYEELRAETDIARIVKAPLNAGDEFGELRVLLGDELVLKVPLVAMQSVAEAGFFTRAWQGVYLFFHEIL